MPHRQPSAQWKVDEGIFAKWLGWKRHPSQGVAHEDLSGLINDSILGVAEHKTTSSFPPFLRKAFSQAADNKNRHPDAQSFVFVTWHQGPGKPVRRFIMHEIHMQDSPALHLAAVQCVAESEARYLDPVGREGHSGTSRPAGKSPREAESGAFVNDMEEAA